MDDSGIELQGPNPTSPALSSAFSSDISSGDEQDDVERPNQASGADDDDDANQAADAKDNDDDGDDDTERVQAKVIIGENVNLSRKYEGYLTIDNDEIVSREDKIDALISLLKLPHIYTLSADTQFEILQEKYPWIDDEDGEIDQFQLEEIQEVVQNMTAVEQRQMYDTTSVYDEDNAEEKEKHVLQPVQLKSMRRYRKMLNNDKQYVCDACGVVLEYKKDKKKHTLKKSKAWRGYRCAQSEKEYIFHNRLCVKLRKAKEFIRDEVYHFEVDKDPLAYVARMQIDFMRDEQLDGEFRPLQFYTTFDESQKSKVKWTRNIRKYYRECVNTDLRGFDIDEGDRFEQIPVAIKYLDMREFAIPMFHFLMRSVQIKDFPLFWQLIKFFTSYINTPKLIRLLKEYSPVVFGLHDDTHTGDSSANNELIDFLTVLCEGALYPIATCLYISAYLEENGEAYWNDEETEVLSRHFRNMASSIIDEIESEHLVAIILETPTNIFPDAEDDADGAKGLSVMDIALEYEMLKFLQNQKIMKLATSLWYERKIIHPHKVLGTELAFADLFKRLWNQPAKFYFSPSGLNIIRLGLFCTHLILFSYVTMKLRYNLVNVANSNAENLLWLFNIAAIIYEFYRCVLGVGPRNYFSIFYNVFEFVKALLWVLLFVLKFVYPVDCTTLTTSGFVRSDFTDNFGGAVDALEDALLDDNDAAAAGADSNMLFFSSTQADASLDCADVELRNSNQVESYMILWSVQCILFWLTPLFYLQRTETTGPLLHIIGLMTRDMMNFLLLAGIFWIGVSFAIFYVVNEDLKAYESEEGDSELTGPSSLGDLSSCIFYGFLMILGQQDWDSISNTSELIGLERSLLLDFYSALTAVVGTVLLLNLLIAMLSTTFADVSEVSALQVNYIRVTQSYAAARDISLIPPPLNYFAFMLMAVWFIVDLLVTVCTARTKMLNDWYFTPLNRTVFSAGDFVEYRDYDDDDADGGGSGGGGEKTAVSSGFVQHQRNNEWAQIQIANKIKHVHKDDILSIHKSILTDRLSDADANGLCASITTSGRYYCKYCRYLFHGDQVGNMEQISDLFSLYGEILDEDDIGKLSNMLGERRSAGKRRKKKKMAAAAATATTTVDEEENDRADVVRDYNRNLRTQGVAQLCPQCYRPFYCSEDHSDEVRRLQYLGEVCSFWVFMIILWVPLLLAFMIPAIFSRILQIATGKKNLGGQDNQEQKDSVKLARKIKMSQSNDDYRQKVVKTFEDVRPATDYVNNVTSNMGKIHKKIRETREEDEDDNLVTQVQEQIDNKKLEFTPMQAREQMAELNRAYRVTMNKLNIILSRIKKGKKGKHKQGSKLA